MSGRPFLLATAACLVALAPGSAALAADSWEWSITPYVWFADTSYELTARDQTISAGEVDFGELADALDGAFQVVAEASHGRWSGFVDFTYLSTSDAQEIDLPVVGSLRADTGSDQYFVDAAVAFWPWRDVSGFNVYAGLRYTDLDNRIGFDRLDPPVRLGVIDINRSFTDALIGFRDRFKLAENWALVIRMDYGFGDSDGVFLVQGAVRWAVGGKRRHGIVLGYRYKDAEFDGSGLTEQYEYKGPIIGFNFRF